MKPVVSVRLGPALVVGRLVSAQKNSYIDSCLMFMTPGPVTRSFSVVYIEVDPFVVHRT